MSHRKRVYHVLFVKIVDNHLEIFAEMNLWAYGKNDLYTICKEAHPDLIPLRYIK